MARPNIQKGHSSSGKKGNKKHGRNRDKGKRYRDRGTREKNKARRAERLEFKYEKNRARRESLL